MADTRIEWTDRTWNPTTGCSLGCTYCYAEKMAHRLKAMGQPKYRQGFTPACHPGELVKPVRWKKPCRVFINSMGDLFDPAIPEEFINKVVTTIFLFPEHTFQVLTKQPQRMQEYFSAHQSPPNLWLGVTVENQAAADARIPLLLNTPATVRFVSIEPMRGAVDLERIYWPDGYGLHKYLNCLNGLEHGGIRADGVFNSSKGNGYVLPGLDWVIVGGMTGKNAVPMHPDWIRTLRDQCKAAEVPFFFKGWGEWRPRIAAWEPRPFGIFPDGRYYQAGLLMGCINAEAVVIADNHAGQEYEYIHRVGKKAAGSRIDGQEWKQFPEGKWVK